MELVRMSIFELAGIEVSDSQGMIERNKNTRAIVKLLESFENPFTHGIKFAVHDDVYDGINDGILPEFLEFCLGRDDKVCVISSCCCDRLFIVSVMVCGDSVDEIKNMFAVPKIHNQ